MKKNTYRIKETKEGYYEFTYSGSLECVLEKLRRDLEKEEKNPDIVYWEWIRKRAQGNIQAHERKVLRLRAFIECAEKHLEEGAE